MSIEYKNNISPNPNFSLEEDKVLKFWEKEGIFEKSLNLNPENNQFVFYDGPPFANGLPHYGHLLTSCVKDTVGRFQTMCGKNVARKFGWDCHGLPAEMAAEKELNVSGRKAIEEFGIAKFNDHCKNDVMKYSGEWRKYIDRIGRWVDMDNAYKTMDVDFMESIFWAFKNLYDKGLVYEEMRVMPYSWACQTPLSNFETRLDNSYRQKESKSVIVKFLLHFAPDSIKNLCKEAYLLVWTTTPWTLPSNLAIAINKDLDYEYVIKDDIAYISLNLRNYLKDLGVVQNSEEAKNKELLTLKGMELIGIFYQPLFDFFIKKASKNSFQIFHGDFVTAGDGTGVVHIAPGFGEDDFELCKKNEVGLKIFSEDKKSYRITAAVPVDDSGRFTSDVYDFQEMHVFDANDEVIKALKIKGNWVKTDQYLHQYPHCWRTDTPIIYKAMPSFYIKVAQARDRLCELNQEINWIPENVKDGIFGNWLKEARDWSISRNRFFGTPIPVWKSTDPQYPCIKVFGSIKELEEFFGPHYEKVHNKKLKITDLHRQFIDELTAPNPNDPTKESMLVRIPDVFDCWFESGSMSFAEVHYPFNQDSIEFGEKPVISYEDAGFSAIKFPPKRLPADFIVEYTAQTRGWFYTLMVLSTLIFDKIPFKNCICHGVILDERGQKLSKRLQNYIDPIEAMNEYGADALRYVMLSSNVMNGGELLIDKDGKMLQEAIKEIHKPIWSALNFFILYAKEDKPNLKVCELSDLKELMMKRASDYYEGVESDCFIVGRAHELHYRIFEALNSYRVADAYKEVRDFIDDLNNCYIRYNRDRFWGSEMGVSKSNAYDSLYTALYYLSTSIAPLLPFLAEILFQTIQNNKEKSVHLQKYKISDLYDLYKSYFNRLIESKLFVERSDGDNYKDNVNYFNALKAIDHAVGSLRDDKLQIRRRQPLKKITIFTNHWLKMCSLKHPDYQFYMQNSKRLMKAQYGYIEKITNSKKVLIDYLSEDKIAEYVEYFTRNLKLNTRALGKKYGAKLRDMQTALNKKEFKLLNDGCIEIAGLKLEKDEFFWDVQIQEKYQNRAAVAMSEGNHFLIVLLDDELDEELVFEGMVRDVIRAIQDARKKHLHISDRIELHLFSDEEKVIDACRRYKSEIVSETLVKSENDLYIYDAFEDFYCDGVRFLEDKLVNNEMVIFGYQVEDAKARKDYDLKLSYRVI
jgi:isoleucyl-tRNA synthetase